jgi:hypothetical protein
LFNGRRGPETNTITRQQARLGWAIATTSAADAPKIGTLFPGPKGPVPSVDALVKALADLGYKDGSPLPWTSVTLSRLGSRVGGALAN